MQLIDSIATYACGTSNELASAKEEINVVI